MMAKAFPNSQFIGYDFHPGSIDAARAHAAAHGVADNARFEVGTAKDFAATGLDLVTFFDCLHDMGDPDWRRSPCPPVAEAGGFVDDRRADGGRQP